MTQSRQQQAVELAKRGMPPFEIAREMGVKTPTVSGYLCLARAEGQNVPLGKPGRRRTRKTISKTVVLTETARAKLQSHADTRGIPVRLLAHRLLHNILDDDLVDAILDDTESANGQN